MKLYVFFNTKIADSKTLDIGRIQEILSKIAMGTDTSDLVVVLYLNNRATWFGGVAYVRAWVSPQKFLATHGKWRLAAGRHAAPTDLPARFKLIRMMLPGNLSHYPLSEKDRYHWLHHFSSFDDHLAHLFAHELHHYRRHHLGFHHREGEHGANRWALSHVLALGFKIESTRLPTAKRSTPRQRKTSLAAVLNPNDFISPEKLIRGRMNWRDIKEQVVLHLSRKAREEYIITKEKQFDYLRSLPEGTILRISFDPSQRYSGSHARLVRSLRRNSLRMVVQTFDGKNWRWPLAWLEVAE
jgi:hypothetical protein